MPAKPWESPEYVPNLVRDLENDFGIMPYRDKTLFFPRPSFLKNAFRNFQWVKTGDLRIARCAQPGYSAFSGDKDHSFNTKQRNFLAKNNIKTIISLNSKRHKTESETKLSGMGIKHYHISVVDFTALSVNDHELINDIITSRQAMGGFLFYCGYGEGRTGTAIAGCMIRYIKTRAPHYFIHFTPAQLHEYVMSAFGVEKAVQTQSIADYMMEMATVAPAPGTMQPRPLSEVSYATFEDDISDTWSVGSYRPLPTLPTIPLDTADNPPAAPGGKPVFNQGTRPNTISIHSLNPTGNIANTGRDGTAATAAPLKISSDGWNRRNGFAPNPTQAQDMNLNSFYFNRHAFDNISV